MRLAHRNHPGGKCLAAPHHPATLRELDFAPGSIGPKVRAACEFVEQTIGVAGIGQLSDALAILEGKAGTMIERDAAQA